MVALLSIVFSQNSVVDRSAYNCVPNASSDLPSAFNFSYAAESESISRWCIPLTRLPKRKSTLSVISQGAVSECGGFSSCGSIIDWELGELRCSKLLSKIVFVMLASAVLSLA